MSGLAQAPAMQKTHYRRMATLKLGLAAAKSFTACSAMSLLRPYGLMGSGGNSGYRGRARLGRVVALEADGDS